MGSAPYGYRYIGRHAGGGTARVEVVEDEARRVRQLFAWVGVERVSLREAGRRLQALGCPTRTGLGHWDATTLCGMLRNPAYRGSAMFGRTRVAVPAQVALRPVRGRTQPPGNAANSSAPVPQEEWIAIPVPAIVDAGVFEAVQAQLEENRRRRREGRRRPGWLLQGLVVCRQCGYAFYGKMARGLVGGRQPADYGYYRCPGTDGHKFGGQALCRNRSVRSDKLEQAVWRQVEAALADPRRVAAEHERRVASVRDGKAREDVTRLERQIARLRRGMDRLIDSYAEEVIDADEFKPRLSGLRQRLVRLQTERDQAAVAHEAERSLQLVIGHLEAFVPDWRARLARSAGGHPRPRPPHRDRLRPSRGRVPHPGNAITRRRRPIRARSRRGWRANTLSATLWGELITRLIGAVLLEANDEWQLQHRYMQIEAMAELITPDPETLRLPPLAA
jgi:site-specific DNA recombinase